MTKTQIEDGVLLAEGPPSLSPEKQSRLWVKQGSAVIDDTTEGLIHGMLKVTACGAFFNHICEEGKRLGVIPHGQFGPWIEKNFPQIPKSTLYRWREAATKVAELLGLAGGQNSHNGNFDGSAQLTLFRVAFGKSTLSKQDLGIRERLVNLIEGKTQKQLVWDFKEVVEAPNGEVVVSPIGGDRVWDAFIRKKHPELIVNGKLPKRGRVDQAVRDEFAASAPKPKPPSADELQQDARVMLAEWLQVTRSLVAYEHLPTLLPQEFTAPMAILETLRAKLKMLHGRYRKPAPRKRKKAPAPDVLLPDTRRAIKASVIEGRKNEQSNRAPALAERAA